jgi:hypothetical protein
VNKGWHGRAGDVEDRREVSCDRLAPVGPEGAGDGVRLDLGLRQLSGPVMFRRKRVDTAFFPAFAVAILIRLL